MVSRDAKVIARHRNPVGIVARALLYPTIGLGVWRRRFALVAAGLVGETLLWTVVPPVHATFAFVDEAIDTELDWLNAPPGQQKSLSFALLALFPTVLLAGLWRHSWRLLTGSGGIVLAFYAAMRRVAARS